MLALISVSMLTAIAVMSVRSLVIPVFAIKEHCDKSDSTCDIKTAENSPATQEDEPYTDSNIIDEDSDPDEYGYQTEADNSTSSINSQDVDQFSPIGV